MSGFIARVCDEAWRPPNVAGVHVRPPRGKESWGTALLVGDRYAVTCRHVLSLAAGEKSGIALDDLTVELRTGEGARRLPARVVPESEDVARDLVLLRLEQPFERWMELPPGVPRSVQKQVVVALGTATSDLHPTSHRGDMDLFTVQRTEGRDEQLVAPFGAPGGFSGGPVFAEDEDGAPLLVGLSRLGGDGVAWGKIIARDSLVDFLIQHLPVLHDAAVCPESWRGTWRAAVGRRGLKPDVPWPGAVDQPPFWHVEPRPGRHAYVGVLPLASDGWGRLKLADHLPDAAAVHRRLEMLSVAFGRPLRLPTSAELLAFEARLGAAPRYRLAGLPPDLRLFGDVAAPRPAPEGCLEWLERGSEGEGGGPGMQLCENLGDGAVRPVTQRAGRPAVMRLAFDA